MRRRSVLGMAAMAGLGGIVPVSRGAQAAPLSPEMQFLSEYMAAAATMLLPSDAAEQARFHILDTLAAIVSGSRLAPGQALVAASPPRIHKLEGMLDKVAVAVALGVDRGRDIRGCVG